MHFPRTHIFIVIILSCGLCSFVAAKFTDDASHERFTTESALLDISQQNSPEPKLAPNLSAPNLSAPNLTPNLTSEQLQPPLAEVEPQPEPEPLHHWRAIHAKVKPGDSLARIFKRHGLSGKDVHQVSSTKPLGSRLRNIFPGHEMTFEVDDAQRLMRMTYSTGPLDTMIFNRTQDGFRAEQVTNEPERVIAYKHGTIENSLFVASKRAGLPDSLTMRLAQIFQWDIDFVLDIRPDDKFYVIYEELYLDGEFVGHGNILAADFVNQGEHFRAIKYIGNNGNADYFSPNGASMRKAFLRAPVQFSRISSNFNPRRVHPLFKTVRPHRGIDYAAPRGTPILAAGDGRVIAASRGKANGNYVFIAHGEQFVTKYLHLSKFGRGVKKGAKVTQGQVIGQVGATGWATAPHLHYEFLVNGVHKNPRTVSLPDASPIDNTEMSRFKSQTVQYATLLDDYKTQITVASAR